MDRRTERFNEYLANVEITAKYQSLPKAQKLEIEQLLETMVSSKSRPAAEKYQPGEADLNHLQLFAAKIISIAPQLLPLAQFDAKPDNLRQFALLITWLAWATDCCLNILDGDGMPELDSDVADALLAGRDLLPEPAAMQH